MDMMMKEIAEQDPWVRQYRQIFIVSMLLCGSFQYSRYNCSVWIFSLEVEVPLLRQELEDRSK